MALSLGNGPYSRLAPDKSDEELPQFSIKQQLNIHELNGNVRVLKTDIHRCGNGPFSRSFHNTDATAMRAFM